MYHKTIAGLIDAHFHGCNFRHVYVDPIELIKTMNENNVVQMVCFGLPVKKKKVFSDRADKASYYRTSEERVYDFGQTDNTMRELIARLPLVERSRFHLGLCGFNPCDMDSADLVIKLLEASPGAYRFVGETFSHHDHLSVMNMDQEISRIDHPALMKLYRALVDRKELFEGKQPVVMVHHNLGTNVRGEALRFVSELDNALFENPALTFVIPHVGYTPGLKKYLQRYYPVKVQKLLRTHHNLFFDLSWAVFDELICADLRTWADVLREFPDRFMIGTDKLGLTREDPGHTLINGTYYYLTLNKDDQYELGTDKSKPFLVFSTWRELLGNLDVLPKDSEELVATLETMLPDMENYSKAINKYLILKDALKDDEAWRKISFGTAAKIFS